MNTGILAGGLGCLLALSVGCSQKKAALPLPPSPAPTDVSKAPPAAKAPVTEVSLAASEVHCTAKTSSAVHLRQSEQEKASGPELPAGTEVVVLARGQLERKGLPIFRVQVTSTAQTGYVFLSQREMGPGCPFVWPDLKPPKKAEPQDTKLEAGDKQCFRSGTFQKLSQIYQPACVSDYGKPGPARHEVDVDGDGRLDELLDYGDELVLVLHTAAGFKPLLIGQGMNTEHHDATVKWLEPVHAGDKVYLATAAHEAETFESGSTNTSSFSLDLVHPDGKVFEVFNLSIDQPDLELEFRGNKDGSVVLTDGKGRNQTLHWNAALERFVL